MEPSTVDRRGRLAGPAFALGAFLSWGLSPIYFKAVADVPAWEILLHRVAWTWLLLVLTVLLLGRLGTVTAVLRGHRARRALLGSTPLIVLNWLVFIWAVQTGRVLEASLGYFINPLVNVVLGRLFLRERLGRLQGLAVALAAASVLLLTLDAGRPPWISLTLGISFGLYGLIRKVAPVDALSGLLLETALLVPLAAGCLIWLGATGQGTWAASPTSTKLLLLAVGVVTAVPLLCFVAAARRMTLTGLGFAQYLAPTCHFVLAVAVFGEPFRAPQLVAFCGIWAALAVFSGEAAWRMRAASRAAPL
jgi:chloramphenicol-sensitive protein RarD